MCGIIGFVSDKEKCKQVLLEGLFALEYRGYDSAGVAIFDKNGKIDIVKAAGKIRNIEEQLNRDYPEIDGTCGIGHTRWATHGAPTDENSHPHGNDYVRIVHNGIIENYTELKNTLISEGYEFKSETDTEVAALTIDKFCRNAGDKMTGVRLAVNEFRGSYALGIIFADEPGVIYAARYESPLIIGLGEGENFLASDITAILSHTRNFIRLENGQCARITRDKAEVFDKDGAPVNCEISQATWSVEAARKGGYKYFMKKEIHEEPEMLRKTLAPRIKNGVPDFSFDGFDGEIFKKIQRLRIVGCGSAMHVGLIAKNCFEKFAKLPTEVEIASEFRYGSLLCGKGDMIIIISQSGETADSLAALRAAKQRGAYILGVVNVVGSTIAREADNTVYTMAGPEIAVATTKAFSVQCALLSLLSLRAAAVRGTLPDNEVARLTSSLSGEAVRAVEKVLERRDEIKTVAKRIVNAGHLFFIGRGIDSAICCEGSLKLKEISYIHSEAYAAGELKHGTISLITEGTPVIAISSTEALADKMQSNIREVMARGGDVIYIGRETDREYGVKFVLPRLSNEEFYILPIATTVQLLAYYTTEYRGYDVDQPRNLAKSVTVE